MSDELSYILLDYGGGLADAMTQAPFGGVPVTLSGAHIVSKDGRDLAEPVPLQTCDGAGGVAVEMPELDAGTYEYELELNGAIVRGRVTVETKRGE